MELESRLQELFKRCDSSGTGHVGKEELRSLCRNLSIPESDADAIFLDLDHDGDGQISVSDFAYGFKDFVTPGSRRGSLQTDERQQLAEMQKKHYGAIRAWTSFSRQAGLATVEEEGKVTTSKLGRSLSNDPTELLKAFSMVMGEVQKLQDEYKHLESSFKRSTQAHADQLAALGEELDAQLARTKAEARQEAAKQMESERRKLMNEMETQISEISAQLLTFQKVETWLEEEWGRREKQRDEGLAQAAEVENKNLKSALLEAQTRAGLLQSQLAARRHDYMNLCEELQWEKTEHKNTVETLQSHLTSLSDANRSLADTHDMFLSAATFATTAPSSGPSSFSSAIISQTPEVQKDGVTVFMPTTAFQSFTPSPADSGRETLLSTKEEEDFLPPPKIIERTFKVILAGDAGVGKTTFIERVCQNHFVPNLSSTIGVDFRVKTLEMEEEGENDERIILKVSLQLWDTAGQERFRSLTLNYFRRADGVLLLYDVSNENSFLAIRNWVMSVQESTGGRKLPILLCGNKKDLRKIIPSSISVENGEKLAKEVGALFIETSPKSGEGVHDALKVLAKSMRTLEDAEVAESVRLSDAQEGTWKKKCCSSS